MMRSAVDKGTAVLDIEVCGRTHARHGNRPWGCVSSEECPWAQSIAGQRDLRGDSEADRAEIMRH
eukprot:5537592-Pleurochrysis_carterae.AAC.1